MAKILDNIRKIREDSKLSQEEIGLKLNISQSAYARFERGATKTDLKMLDRFAKAMNISLIDIVTYPDKFINVNEVEDYRMDVIEATLSIKLSKEKKEKVLRTVFGDEGFEILK